MARPKRLALAMLFLCVACVAHDTPSGSLQSPSQLQLEIELRDGEHSKDSHEQVIRCIITDNRVEYHGPYGTCPRGQCKHRRVSFLLTKPRRQKVMAIVANAHLFTDYQEIKPTNLIGHYYDLKLEVHQNSKHGAMRIIGMFHSQHQESHLSDQAQQRVRRVHKACSSIRDLARPGSWVDESVADRPIFVASCPGVSRVRPYTLRAERRPRSSWKCKIKEIYL